LIDTEYTDRKSVGSIHGEETPEFGRTLFDGAFTVRSGGAGELNT
jgi:hypothetical protein